MDNEVKKEFTPKPMISFRGPRTMSNYLLRAKLHLQERMKGSFKCGSRRCEVCLNVNEKYAFTSTVTGETYIINHKVNCNDKCLAYLLTCNCCRNQMWVKQSTNFVLDGSIIKVIVGNINVV